MACPVDSGFADGQKTPARQRRRGHQPRPDPPFNERDPDGFTGYCTICSFWHHHPFQYTANRSVLQPRLFTKTPFFHLRNGNDAPVRQHRQ